MFQLRSVGFIGEAYNISPIIDQADFIILTVTKLLNGTNIEAAAFSCAQFFTELVTVRNNANLSKIQKFFALGEKFCPLFLQLIPVNDHNNSR